MILAQVGNPPPPNASPPNAPPLSRFFGIRDHFASGKGFADLMLAAVVIALGIVLLYGLLRLVQRRQRVFLRHPGKLFAEILKRIPVSPAQRELLRRIARDLRLEHPAILLLAPRVFRNQTNRWMSLTRSANPHTRQRLDFLAETLFPPSRHPPAPAPTPTFGSAPE